METAIKIDNIKWEIENRCNLNCKHCFLSSDTKNYRRISYNESINIVDKLADFGVKVISFTTMEPLLFDGICDLIKYCNSKHIFTILLTNGTLLTDYNLAEKLIDSGIGMVSISLEGISEQSNDYIRGKGTLEKVLKALENLETAQEHLNCIQIGLQMTLNKYSAQEASDIPVFINNLPVDLLQIGSIVNVGNAKEFSDLKLSDKDMIVAWNKMERSYQKLETKNFQLVNKTLLPFENALSNIKNQADYLPASLNCSAIRNGFSLLPDGSLVPCVGLLNKNDFNIPIVNLLKIENNFDEMNRFKQELTKYIRKSKKEVCMNCYFGLYCFACPVEISRNGSLDYVTNRCKIAKKEINYILERIFSNPNYYNISIRSDVFFTIEDNIVFLKRYYNIGTLSKEKKYKIDNNGINLLEELISKKFMNLNDIINSYFINSNEAFEFLIPLLYDNYIFIKKKEE